MDQKHDDPHVDAATGYSTTGHEWDGIRELNTPLPRWWLGIFYATIVWSIGYWIVYPAWPLLTDATRGVIGYASRADISADMAKLKAQRAAQAAGMADATPAQIKADSTLFQIAMAQGKAAFGDNCAACHGVGGAGAKGYPNLNDDDWLWGGSLPAIQQTIRHGIRVAGDNDTRVSQMPAFGRDGVLKREEIAAVASHVRELAGLPTEPKADLPLGRKVFADNCAACHGPAGKGNQELGAPNLTDSISLYGMDMASLTETISNSRNGVMPAWAGRLDETTIKALTVYVHSLGGGQ
ncbi:Cbb3-type cytochrome c oxidase subunit FixP [Bosea sp. 62]|uniref:cytochrome-c oxidase, cbb3-type subunit III n=1 Tax=unclassified Bosea (in: a-proteobacteria) TaxID=2653178 RepID=UPI001254AF67|nr:MULTISPECIES: cytochrome-c oxidase, cbb3-type subunit III [unclassified Bosea (in: a-proteobacteria)]CAD5255468.1 Cbb3-type cytochrome c oxidase subunit FixP [Bosea sp. 7B]CAD5275331.1 Cbb3-type cytochrome c oxidase subunit FixP [Bosea sp. 21B]CAD5276452.1 Cbb3-type cytochrome c oxidase subunit FixP [Bosea sp. 46]VVT60003.1 Cbb3-type cytochrome c oxidase subunit FixP [Bosea sp. EC-HK365B]VXB51118.1 Cbb3-type cytochrome c oxidase subunit FixP [Bosea sp. 62]